MEKVFGGAAKSVDKDKIGRYKTIPWDKALRLRGFYEPILERKKGNLPYFLQISQNWA